MKNGGSIVRCLIDEGVKACYEVVVVAIDIEVVGVDRGDDAEER